MNPKKLSEAKLDEAKRKIETLLFESFGCLVGVVRDRRLKYWGVHYMPGPPHKKILGIGRTPPNLPVWRRQHIHKLVNTYTKCFETSIIQKCMKINHRRYVAKLNSLFDKLEEPSLHCRSFTNGINNTKLPTFAHYYSLGVDNPEPHVGANDSPPPLPVASNSPALDVRSQPPHPNFNSDNCKHVFRVAEKANSEYRQD